MLRLAAVILSASILIIPGCTNDSGDGTNPDPTGILIDLDRANERPFLEYYFGPYSSGDPFAELVKEDGGHFYLDLDALTARHANAAGLQPAASDGVLTWEELSPFFRENYYDVIDAPATLADLMEESGGAEIESWFELETDGVMTSARRHARIPTSAVRSALEAYSASGNHLRYPIGTPIIVHHVIGEEIVETTAMRKRDDGYWNHFVFDGDGFLTGSTSTPPKKLAVPTQCAGCHLGKRLYEPEKRFPAEARPGPHGPRKVHVDERLRNTTVVGYLDEHRKRSDGVLGLYGTIYLSRLLASRQDGTLQPDDAALLDQLGL